MLFPATAGGTIVPSRFVIASTTVDNQVLQSGAGGKIVGISQKGTRNTPYGALDDGNAALVNESLKVFGLNETATLELGGTVASGDLLKSDANGKGLTASSDGDFYGAIAGQAGVLGQLIEVQVVLGIRGV